MSAERIAQAVRKFREGHVKTMEGMGDPIPPLSCNETVVDISAIYEQVQAMKEFAPYEQVCRPPWMEALLCCDDRKFDATYLVTLAALDTSDPAALAALERQEMQLGKEVDSGWLEHRWVMILNIMGVAYENGSPLGVLGPMATYGLTIDADGTPTKIRGRVAPLVAQTPHGTLTGLDPNNPDDVRGYESIMEELMSTCLAALTFLNCRNVTVAVPHRHRAQARRLDRIGVEVTEIHVYSMGRTVQGTRPLSAEGGVPAHAVRGNLARYGPKYDRGLLFGKHEGVFWRPQHARGNPVHGTREHEYVLEA